ncbi:MAG: DUF501 domain-containing protein [Firmicutes bacterium]|nr:DUF501 domain-containing protein [Bacillota bacterium]
MKNRPAKGCRGVERFEEEKRRRVGEGAKDGLRGERRTAVCGVRFEKREDLSRILEHQLGREPRGRVRVALSCKLGMPMVITTYPVLAPVKNDRGIGKGIAIFPTTFWLTCPRLNRAVADLEAGGWIGRIKGMLRDNWEVRERLLRAHRHYASARMELLTPDDREMLEGRFPSILRALAETGVAGIKDVTNPEAVKCLHAHYAHYLAGYDNPIGEWVDAALFGLL